MTQHTSPAIRIPVDLTNPGQFFACCGLLELADRLWPGAEGWFDATDFCIQTSGTLPRLLEQVTAAELEQIDPDDMTASPMILGHPFTPELILDWWKDEITGGKAFKVWAGRMSSVRIAQAMKCAMKGASDHSNPFDYAAVVYDPDQPKKKVEPFYYDSRRGWNAQPIDIGFSPDSLSMKTMAYPAVEFLCLVGLQRCRPMTTKKRRVFDYHTWETPMPVNIAAALTSGVMSNPDGRAYRFENAFRTDQKKHKSFLPATPLGDPS